jgi:hypothetical protein
MDREAGAGQGGLAMLSGYSVCTVDAGTGYISVYNLWTC